MTLPDSGGTPRHADGADDPFLSPKRGASEVYLIRHGDALPEAHEVTLDTVSSYDGQSLRDYDAQSLSELGRRQAAALARRLREVAPAAFFSSPTARAYQTAEPAARALGLEVTVLDDLSEVALGPIGPEIPAGASAAQLSRLLRAQLRAIAAIALGSGMWSSIPGSEPSTVLRARVTAAIEGITAAHPGQRVAVFSHGGTINAYIAALLGIERDYFFPCANTSISVVRLQGRQALLLALNDVAHLRQAGLM